MVLFTIAIPHFHTVHGVLKARILKWFAIPFSSGPHSVNSTFMAESEEELNSLLIGESERGEWKSWLKAQHSENQDHGISPITSWEIDGEMVETVADFIFLGFKITAHGDCSHEIKRLNWTDPTFYTNFPNSALIFLKWTSNYVLPLLIHHLFPVKSPIQFSSVTESCPTLCNPMNCSMLGLPVHYQLQS